MKKSLSLPLLALSLLLVGAGCAKSGTPSTNAPAANTPVANAPAANGSADGKDTTPAPATGTKKYNSAPYDFSYPAAYILTDHPMVESARKPYLDKGLDAPLQNVSFATVTRPKGFEGEGPATIHVIQWNNAQRTPLADWAKKQAGYVGFTGAKNISSAAFMGKPSLAYEYEGLYGGKARLIDLNGTILQISADFDKDQGNTNMAAFDTILSTLTIAK